MIALSECSSEHNTEDRKPDNVYKMLPKKKKTTSPSE